MTVVVWCLLLFIPASTHVSQGCYLTEPAAFAGGTLALWATSRRLAVLIVACHFIFSLAIFVLLPPYQSVGFSTLIGPVNPVLGFVGVLSAIAFLLLLWQIWKEASSQHLRATNLPERETAHVAI
jgi:hypothetical protein